MTFLIFWSDVIAFLVLMGIHFLAWTSIEHKLPGDVTDEPEVRSFGQKAIGHAVRTCIVATTVLIPGSLLIAQLGITSSAPLPPETLQHIFRASLWFLLSIFAGLFMTGWIPMRGQTHDVSRDKRPAMVFGVQLFSLFVGVSHLVLSLIPMAF